MRGLPFPTNALFDPEATSDHGTPFSGADDIPIDPALAGTPAIHPAITDRPNVPPNAFQQVNFAVAHVDSVTPRTRHYSQEPLQYDQGPQGDPFAPQPPAAYLPIPDEQVAPVPRPQKRKRKPRREEECGFCQGNDSKNKEGEPEPMVSCEECGRSGHPSCMELGRVADVVRSYPWKCIECKTCEICQEKGDDARILFCDFCDRGWHMDCLQPPLEEEPPGQWHCPRCPSLELFSPAPDFLSQEETILPNGPHRPGKMDESKAQGPPEPESDVHLEVNSNADDDSSSDSSDSDSDDDDDNTVSAATPRRVQPIKRRKKPPKQKADPRTPRPAKRMRIRVRSSAQPLIVRLRLPPKGKGKEREDDVDRNIFEDLLAPAERDVSKTVIDNIDRARFDKSKLAAEEKLAPRPALAPEVLDSPVAGPSSRPLRSHALHQLSIPSSLPTPSPVPSTPGFHPPTPGPIPQTPNTPADCDSQPVSLRIRTVRFGQFDIHPWYDAPFPEEYANIPDGRLWICEFCLKYMRSGFAFGRHRMKCKARHPPGDEIYRDGAVSIFEVDGRKNKIYCQNLCLLSKMFLDHKSLFYDVEPFLFYVMTETDDIGARFVGYFSKEKCSPKDYNVSCIMTLPVRQRQGWGNYLIDFSYLLSKKEQRAGSPEKPLSALGALGYKNYWILAVMRYLRTAPPKPTLEDISAATSLTIEDIYGTLVNLNTISVHSATPPPVRPSPGQSIKFPRGRKNGIARRHLQRANTQKEDVGNGSKLNPFVAPTRYEITWNPQSVEHWLDVWEKKGYLKIRPEKLKWTPFVLARTKASGEVLQAEMGIGVGSMGGTARANTPATPLETGMSTMVDGGAEPSAPELAAAVIEQLESTSNHGEHAAGGTDTPAARLFDDELAVTPRNQLRSRLKEGTIPRRIESSRRVTDFAAPTLRYTYSASVRPDLGEDYIDSVPNDTLNGVQDLESRTPALPIKRRRGRPPRARPPDAVPVSMGPEAETAKMLQSSTPRLTPPPKRRRVDSPLHEGIPRSENSDDGVDLEALHPLNGQDPKPNGFHRDLDHHPSDMAGSGNSGELSVGPSEEVKEVGSEDRLCHDDFTGQEHSAVKSEDVGTPLTGLTSRHSIPSDDTVFVADASGGTGVGSKDPGKVEDILPSPRSPGRPPVSGEGEVAAELGSHIIDADSDLDAEGEPDDEIS